MQRNLSYQREIWNGFSSVHGIASTQMGHGQIELPKVDTGKPPEKTGRLCARSLVIHSLLPVPLWVLWQWQGTVRPLFSIVEEPPWVIEPTGSCMSIASPMILFLPKPHRYKVSRSTSNILSNALFSTHCPWLDGIDVVSIKSCGSHSYLVGPILKVVKPTWISINHQKCVEKVLKVFFFFLNLHSYFVLAALDWPFRN